MKCTLLLLTLLLPLSLVAQTNVQKVQGTNVISNGSIVVGNSTSISATGNGSITATAFSGILPVANGGTGVTSSSGANSVVLRDSNSNASVNNLFKGFSTITASGTTVTLTVASAPNFVINGSGGQIIKLPDATTLSNGTDFIFNNNQSSGTVTVQNNSATTVCTLQSGSYIVVTLLSNSTAAGTWDYHNVAPSNASWSTNTLNWAGSYTNGTWNGNAVGALYGGTGTTGLTGYVYGNGTSAMTASTTIPTSSLSGSVSLTSQVSGILPIANGGTGSSTASLVAGTGIAITGTFPNQTINATSGTGTVTSVAGTGTVQGITLTGTVTTSGSLTLGGSLSPIALATQVSGTLNASSGGTGVAGTITGYEYANGTGAHTASTTIPTTALSGTITNAQLTNNSITVTAGSGLSGGGSVTLGGTTTLTNAGVTNIVAGTGITVNAATGSVTINSTATGGVSSITGTTNQVIASASTGAVTLSTPQSIATTSTPQFARMGLGIPADPNVGLLTLFSPTASPSFGFETAGSWAPNANSQTYTNAYLQSGISGSTYTGSTYYNLYLGSGTSSGNLANAYQLYIGALSSGTTGTTKYGIYQAGTDANLLSGTLSVSNSTSSTSTTSGALQVNGGVGVGGNGFFGGNVNISGSLVVNSGIYLPVYVPLYWNDSGGTARRTGLWDSLNYIYYGDIDNSTNSNLYLMSGGTGSTHFYNNGSEHMTITSAGNVGIGTSSPVSLLQVNGNSDLTWGSSASPYCYGTTTIGTGSTATSSLFVNTASINSGYWSGFGVNGTYSSGISTVNLTAYGVYSGGPYGSNLAFRTTSTTSVNERMRIDSSGQTMLGTTTPVATGAGSLTVGATTASTSTTSGALTVAGGVGVGGNLNVGGNYYAFSSGSFYSIYNIGNGYGVVFQNKGIGSGWVWYTSISTPADTVAMVLSPAGVLQLGTYGAGTLVTNSSGVISASSDVRLKNVKHAFTTGLKAITQIHPAVYSWKSEEKEGVHTTYAGFIAQDVKEAIPEAVGQGKDGYLTLQDRAITAALVNAIKEQQKEIEDLQQQIKQLSKQP